MRVEKCSGLILVAVVFAVLLMPCTSWAATVVKNCPPEPTSITISSGIEYAGSNCVLLTPGDIDSFVFSANAGDTYSIIVAFQGGENGTCMKLYDPNGNEIFPSSTNPNNCTGDGDLGVSQALTVTGSYKIILSMENNGSGGDYALSLERVNPIPPDAQELTLAKAVDASFAPANEQMTYTFNGSTTGTYQVSVNFAGGENGTCLYLYYPGSATPQPAPDQGCTGDGVLQFTFTPPKNGTYMLLLTGENDGPGGDYSVEVSCYLGTCQPPPPPTACADALSYNATTGTLTMNFTIATPIAVTWNAWLVSGNTIQSLWSVPEPIIDTKTAVTKTQSNVAKAGNVGVLSTFTTSAKGITCSSWVIVNTGQ